MRGQPAQAAERGIGPARGGGVEAEHRDLRGPGDVLVAGPALARQDAAVRQRLPAGGVGDRGGHIRVGGRERRRDERHRGVHEAAGDGRARVVVRGELPVHRVRDAARGVPPFRRLRAVAAALGEVRGGPQARQHRADDAERGPPGVLLVPGMALPVVGRGGRQALGVQGPRQVVGGALHHRPQIGEVRTRPDAVDLVEPRRPQDPAERVELRVPAVGDRAPVGVVARGPHAVPGLDAGEDAEDVAGLGRVPGDGERGDGERGVAGPGVPPLGVPRGEGRAVRPSEEPQVEQCAGRHVPVAHVASGGRVQPAGRDGALRQPGVVGADRLVHPGVVRRDGDGTVPAGRDEPDPPVRELDDRAVRQVCGALRLGGRQRDAGERPAAPADQPRAGPAGGEAVRHVGVRGRDEGGDHEQGGDPPERADSALAPPAPRRRRPADGRGDRLGGDGPPQARAGGIRAGGIRGGQVRAGEGGAGEGVGGDGGRDGRVPFLRHRHTSAPLPHLPIRLLVQAEISTSNYVNRFILLTCHSCPPLRRSTPSLR